MNNYKFTLIIRKINRALRVFQRALDTLIQSNDELEEYKNTVQMEITELNATLKNINAQMAQNAKTIEEIQNILG